MKRIMSILVCLFFCCFYYNTSTAVTVNQGVTIWSDSILVYDGDRLIDPLTKTILAETWYPFKPGTTTYFQASIEATGYGEVAIQLFRQSKDFDIGDWRTGPDLRAAQNDSITFYVRKLHPAYNHHPRSKVKSPRIRNQGYANEINAGTYTNLA